MKIPDINDLEKIIREANSPKVVMETKDLLALIAYIRKLEGKVRNET